MLMRSAVTPAAPSSVAEESLMACQIELVNPLPGAFRRSSQAFPLQTCQRDRARNALARAFVRNR